MDRHRSVPGNGQDHEQLLQVRPVVLVVAVRHLRGRLSPNLPTVSRAVRPGEGERGRIVVELIEGNLELPHAL